MEGHTGGGPDWRIKMVSRRQSERKIGAGSVKIPPLAQVLVVGVLALTPGVYMSYNAYAELQEVRNSLASVEAELGKQRSEAAIVDAIQREIALLQKEFDNIVWPPKPSKGGLAWIVKQLADSGWTSKSGIVGKPVAAGEFLEETPVTLQVEKTSFEALMRGLETIERQRVIPRSIKLTADSKGNLSGTATFGVLSPTAPGGGEDATR